MPDYIIPKEYQGKNVEVPLHLTLDNVCNDKIILRVPRNACYLDIRSFEPLGSDGEPIRDSDDQLDMNPLLTYQDDKEKLISIQDDLLEFDMFSLDRRLELIFKKYS